METKIVKIGNTFILKQKSVFNQEIYCPFFCFKSILDDYASISLPIIASISISTICVGRFSAGVPTTVHKGRIS